MDLSVYIRIKVIQVKNGKIFEIEFISFVKFMNINFFKTMLNSIVDLL